MFFFFFKKVITNVKLIIKNTIREKMNLTKPVAVDYTHSARRPKHHSLNTVGSTASINAHTAYTFNQFITPRQSNNS